MRSVPPVLVVFFACAVVVLAAERARANVSYTEGTDLGNISATNLGTIGYGGNSVQGQINPFGGPFNQPIQGDTADEFSVVVPANTRMTSLTVHIFTYSSTVAQPARFRCVTVGAGVNTYTVAGFALSSNLITAPGGLIAGTYNFRMESLLSPSGGGNSATIGYIVSMQATDCSAPQPTAAGEECSIRIALPAGGPSVQLYRSMDGSFGTPLATLAAGQTDYIDHHPPGTTATYRVVLDPADNPCGGTTSYVSNAVSATATLPVQPSPVTNASDDGCTGLTWTNGNGAEEAVLTLFAATTPVPTPIYSVTIPATQIPYRFPASFNPFPLLGQDRRAFWGIQTRRTCGGFSSALSITFSPDFTVRATVDTPAVSVVNGPCSVIVTPTVDPRATTFSVLRIAQLGGVTTFDNPPLPSFEDTSAQPGQIYNYVVQAVGCNSVLSSTVQITVQRSPQGGTRPPVRVVEARTATLVAHAPPAGSSHTVAWRRGGISPTDPAGQPVNNGDGGGRISGATTPTLTILNAGPNDTDTYWCMVSSACDPIVSQVNLFLTEGCGGDFNRSGDLTIDDLFLFLNAWFTGCP